MGSGTLRSNPKPAAVRVHSNICLTPPTCYGSVNEPSSLSWWSILHYYPKEDLKAASLAEYSY